MQALAWEAQLYEARVIQRGTSGDFRVNSENSVKTTISGGLVEQGRILG